MALTIFLYVLGLALVLVGLAGLVLPVVPGAPLIFLGILAVAWADGFARIGWPGLLATGALALLITLVDYLAGLVGAKSFGASYWGLAGAVAGLLLGWPFGLPGVVLGPLVGAVLVEYFKEPDFRRAGKIGFGTLAGFVIGTALKYALGCALVGLALLFYFF